ncbi:MAG: hydroxyethylthiazole kinase [Duodenibacillus sp.]|nr:hydroxyethylthiazole kinase [Duodenibacillus sp.]
MLTPEPFCEAAALAEIARMRALSPLVHCLTNAVVQEITANVLLAAGASPAMIPAPEEAGAFAAIAGAVLVNTGTLTAGQAEAMRIAAQSASEHGVPWVLDPVAAGLLAFRDGVVAELLALRPAAVRGNASEILAAAGMGAGGKGVDSTASSDAALAAARALASRTGAVVCVTGATDYVTDGERVLAVSGGCEAVTRVVGTGCSLSALVAAMLAGAPDRLAAAAAACWLAKRAAEYAGQGCPGPGTFKVRYIDGLQRAGARG